jgi:uncharacterized protein YcnI
VGRLLARGGAAVVMIGLLGWATPAGAHVTITPSTTAAGAFAVLQVSVGHGCEGSPTTRITIRMPPDLNAVTPTRTALWEVEKEMERLDPPAVDSHGNEIVERVAAVTYSTQTPLPDGYRDTFELSVQLPDVEGTALVFPTIQTCEAGEAAWIEVPEDGQQVDELELPAPSFVVTATDGAGPSTTGQGTRQEAGGTDALTLVALGAGLLGAVLGAAALVGHRRP